MSKQKPKSKPLPPILVWIFNDAPEELKALSRNGGDEDWIAVVPDGYGYIGWIEDSSAFGSCDVAIYELPNNGGKVYIGSHA